MGKINARAKGHSFERQLVKLFRDLGYTECLTSRLESKRLDDAKVDLCYTDPFYVQAKAVEKLGSVHDILDSMPKKKGKHNLVFHKRSRKGVVVSMMQEDFIELLQMLIKNGVIKPCGSA